MNVPGGNKVHCHTSAVVKKLRTVYGLNAIAVEFKNKNVDLDNTIHFSRPSNFDEDYLKNCFTTKNSPQPRKSYNF